MISQRIIWSGPSPSDRPTSPPDATQRSYLSPSLLQPWADFFATMKCHVIAIFTGKQHDQVSTWLVVKRVNRELYTLSNLWNLPQRTRRSIQRFTNCFSAIASREQFVERVVHYNHGTAKIEHFKYSGKIFLRVLLYLFQITFGLWCLVISMFLCINTIRLRRYCRITYTECVFYIDFRPINALMSRSLIIATTWIYSLRSRPTAEYDIIGVYYILRSINFISLFVFSINIWRWHNFKLKNWVPMVAV